MNRRQFFRRSAQGAAVAALAPAVQAAPVAKSKGPTELWLVDGPWKGKKFHTSGKNGDTLRMPSLAPKKVTAESQGLVGYEHIWHDYCLSWDEKHEVFFGYYQGKHRRWIGIGDLA